MGLFTFYKINITLVGNCFFKKMKFISSEKLQQILKNYCFCVILFLTRFFYIFEKEDIALFHTILKETLGRGGLARYLKKEDFLRLVLTNLHFFHIEIWKYSVIFWHAQNSDGNQEIEKNRIDRKNVKRNRKKNNT